MRSPLGFSVSPHNNGCGTKWRVDLLFEIIKSTECIILTWFKDMLNKETWEFINTFAPWLSAIGTVSAVIVSLYLASRGRKIRLVVEISQREWTTPMDRKITISVTNIGHRDTTITGLYWETGIFRKSLRKNRVINYSFPEKPPIKLKEGDLAEYSINESNFIPNFYPFYERMLESKILLPIMVRSIKVCIKTSTGKMFKKRINKGLQNHLLNIIKK